MATNTLVSWSDKLRKMAETIATPTSSLLSYASGFGKNLFQQNPEIQTTQQTTQNTTQTNQNNLSPIFDTAMSQFNNTNQNYLSIPSKVSVDDLTKDTTSLTPTLLKEGDGSPLVDGIKSLTTPITVADETIRLNQEKQGGIQQQLLDAIRGLSGKGQALQSQYEAMGVPTQEKQLADINTQIAQRTAEYDNLMASLEGQGRGIPLDIIRGQQGAVARQKAIEIGGLAAVQQAIQGNINAAKQTAKDSVDLEYEDRLTEISALQQQLDFIDKDLTSAEKKRSEELSIALENQKAEIENQKEERNRIIDLMLKARESGSDATTLQKIMLSKSLGEAITYMPQVFSDSTGELKNLGTSDNPNWSWVYPNGDIEPVNIGVGQNQVDPSVIMGLTKNSQDIDDLLGMNFTSITGFKGIGAKLPFGIGSASHNMALATAKNIMENISLDARSKLKGQGQISDFEGRMLARASSRLYSAWNEEKQMFNLSNSDFEEVLKDTKAGFIGSKNYQLYKAGNSITLEQFLQGLDTKNLEEASKIINANPNLSEDEILIKLIPPEWNLGFNQGGSGTPIATLNKVLQIPTGKKAGQCGHFVNKITGLGLGDSYQSKLNKMNPAIKKPQPGMAFVMPLTGEFAKYGHTGIILSVNNGMATVKDSNWGKDEKVRVHQIPVSKMTGFAYPKIA